MTRRSGTTLMEVLVAVSVFAVVIALTSRLYLGSVSVQGAADRAAWSTIHVETALRRLRADVWNAAELRITGEGALKVVRGDGAAVTYGVHATWTADGADDDTFGTPALRRTVATESDAGDADDAVTEMPLPEVLRFEAVDAGTVRVLMDDAAVTLVSELRRLRRTSTGGAR